jgi:hypothetical protein
MSFELQGIEMLGIKSEVDADHLNALRWALLNAIGIDNFKATNQGTTTPASQIELTSDRVRLWDPTGNTPGIAKDVDVTVDLSAGGLDTGSLTSDTWYYLWLIALCGANDGRATNLAAIASLSASAPTMPAGYTHRRLVGFCRTDPSSNLFDFVQIGPYWLFLERQQVLYSAVPIARTTYSLANFMPPEALIGLLNYRTYSPFGTSEAGGGMAVTGATEEFTDFDSDKVEESQATVWMPCIGQQADIRWREDAGTNYLYVYSLGSRWPINKEP